MTGWLDQIWKDVTEETVLYPTELVVTVFCILAFQIPAVKAALRSIRFDWFHGLARRKAWAVAAVTLLAFAGHGVVEPMYVKPAPGFHDEFSYLLAAETFASGRIANPPHPMRFFFESFHTLQEPAYMSMYPPGQGIAMASGILLGGHPIWGVWLSAALFCGAVCWALQGWMNSSWALLGALICVVRIGWFSYWANSYWGGAVAGVGGALLIGAAGRLRRRPHPKIGAIAAAGILILANSRLFEGFVTTAILLVWLAIRWRNADWREVARAAIPAAAMLALGAVAMGYYNYRITGNALRLPYVENRERYQIHGSFVWSRTEPPRTYNHPELERFYKASEAYRDQIGYARIQAEKPVRFWLFFVGPALTLAFAGLWRGRRIEAVRLGVALLGGLVLAHLPVPWQIQPHYASPVAGAFYLVFVTGLRRLHLWRPAKTLDGSGLASAVVAAVFLMLVFRTVGPSLGAKVYQERTNPWYSYGLMSNFNRDRMEKRLAGTGGQHLVLVEYSQDHRPDLEWVYNHADIDGSPVVWARYVADPQRLQPLLDYYKNRRIWLVRPDTDPSKVTDFRDVRKGAAK